MLNWDGCWLSSSAMVWPHTFFIFTCCVCILLAFYVYTFTSDILILLATSTSNKWIVYQNEENNVTPINPCLTSCTRLFDMLFIKIEIRHISNSCKISVTNWNWTLYLKIYFQFLFSFALTYYNLVQMPDLYIFCRDGIMHNMEFSIDINICRRRR